MKVSGVEGYAETAESLVPQYEGLSFAQVHAAVIPLLPAAPARVVDIGAGTGRDAAALAAMGHRVLAVEPTAEMRAIGLRLHSAAAEWLDDSLPDLAKLRARGEAFDLAMMTAVWMHLDEAQRATAMPHVAGLLAPGGVLTMTLRHGPVPEGRRMFDVSAEETAELAARHGLVEAHRSSRGSLFKAAQGVSWDILAFRKA